MKNTKLLRLTSLLLVVVLCSVMFVACDKDNDDTGTGDCAESNGSYRIDLIGSSATITISNVNSNSTGNQITGHLSGTIYIDGREYSIIEKNATLTQKKGDLWYTWISIRNYKNNSSTETCLYFVRDGIGAYVGSGSLGVTVLGSGGTVQFSYVSYNNYGRLLYCKYGPYDYNKYQ